ncbi:putative ribonuclease H-like domain-containing protein [Tanacetum coccineum]|uniref:Ribonuclease H-like domain-containing protein n=1 Tax=Tanacetum coccineum TaxID=301880 RepID=A0ABQ5A517_9ASTR
MQTEHTNSTNSINTVSTPVSTAGTSFDNDVPSPPVNTDGPSVSTANAFEEHLIERFSPFKNTFILPPVPNVSSMDKIGIFGNAYDDEDLEEQVDMNNIEEEVYVCQPLGFEDPHIPDKVYKVEKALYGLHQAPRAWYETLSTYLLDNGSTEEGMDLYHAKHTYVVEDTEKRIFRYLKGQPKLGLWYPRDSPFNLEAFSDSDYAGASLDRKSTIGGKSKEVGTPRYLSLVVPLKKVGNEAVHKELGDRMERAATTASSLEVEQDSVNAVRHQLVLPVQVPAVEGDSINTSIKESDGFAEIIDFLKASSAHYALTVNPTIYTYCIEQFWATAKVQTVNGVRQLQALVDKKRVIVTELSIRRDLQLDDA